MDPFSVLGAIIAAIAGLSGADKAFSLRRFLRRRKNYEDALFYRKELLNFWIKPSQLKNDEFIKRVILHDRDIADYDKMIEIYSMLSDNLKKEEMVVLRRKYKNYALLSDYFNSTIKIGNSRIGLALNSGLISSLLQNFLSATDRSAINRSTVVGMLVGKKMRQDTRSYIFLLSGIFLHSALSFFGIVNFNLWLIGFLVFMVGALAVNQKVMEYRIKYGLYGGTAYEAREILKFIDEYSNKDDFGSGGGQRNIFQDAVEQAPKELVIYGGAY